MTPAVRSLVAAVIAVLAVGAPTAAAPARPADGVPGGVPGGVSGGARPTGERAIFTGELVRLRSEFDGDSLVRIYQVAVAEVYGDVDVPTRRVSVQSPVDLESCGVGVGQGQAGPTGTGGTGGGGTGTGGAQQEQATPGGTPTGDPSPSQPATPGPDSPSLGTGAGVDDDRLRVFDTTFDGDRYVVAGCARVRLVDASVRTTLLDAFGEGRPPGTDEEPSDPAVAEVGYLCPDTRDAVRLDDEGSCATLAEGQSFDRAAAPGLALVIVGVLGLLLARRMGRPRRR